MGFTRAPKKVEGVCAEGDFYGGRSWSWPKHLPIPLTCQILRNISVEWSEKQN